MSGMEGKNNKWDGLLLYINSRWRYNISGEEKDVSKGFVKGKALASWQNRKVACVSQRKVVSGKLLFLFAKKIIQEKFTITLILSYN